MAILKCKMCGGDLVLHPDSAIAECEYCGTVQTVPAADNEKMLALFSRAHRLRADCEFDKASGIYESITVDFPEEAEAYWGLVLCKYGIEYVDDPKTGDKVPTCHRTSFESVLTDANLDQVLLYAQSDARELYRRESEEIEELRKNIIAVSSKADPYDIFICYKETDEKGQRTLDSVLAQDVYEALTAQGYRVFFSRISLENTLGKEYEPYIFAALHSARIMLVFATDSTYVNSVWVKNEWSRFLSLIAKGERKYLIPCYKGISIRNLPQEFTRLQAQDMGKVGAIQDLIRGIGKIMHRQQPEIIENPVNPQKGRNTKNGKLMFFLTLIVVLLAAALSLIILSNNQNTPETLFAELSQYLRSSDYQNADTVLSELSKKDVPPDRLEQAYLQYLIHILLDEYADPSAKTEALDQYHTLLETLNSSGVEKAVITQVQLDMLKSRYQELLADEQYDKVLLLYETLENPAPPSEEVLQAQYATAKSLLQNGNIEQAVEIFTALGDYQDASSRVQLAQAEAIYQAGNSFDAALAYYKMKDIPGAWERCTEIWSEMTNRSTITAAADYVAVVNQDGTAADYDTQSNTLDSVRINNMVNLIAIDAGDFHTVGLRADGTVMAAKLPRTQSQKNQCYVSHWSDIVAIAAAGNHTLGLKADGTVLATGEVVIGSKHTLYDVSRWNNIVAIAAGANHAVGLKTDGTVVATGQNQESQCEVSDWTDIVAVSAGNYHTVGLKEDGTVVIAGNTGDGKDAVSKWTEIVAVSAGKYHTIGLTADGTAVVAGLNVKQHQLTGSGYVNITAGDNFSIALHSNSTLVWDTSFDNKHVPNWNDILLPR